MHESGVESGSHERPQTRDGQRQPAGGAAVASPRGWKRLRFLGFLLIPILSFSAAFWVFDYIIIAHSQSRYSFFMFGGRFLAEILDHPGGLLQYADRFLGQFCHYTWLGALVISLLITCFAVLFHLVLTKLRRTVWLFHTFLPCLLLLTIPQWSLGEVTLGLIAGCAAFLGYLSLPRRVARPVYTLLAIPVLYVVIGGYFWLFAVWVIAAEWLDGPISSNLARKIVYPALALCVPLAAYRWLFFVPLTGAFTYPLNMIASSSLWKVMKLPSSLWAVALAAYVLVVPFAQRISRGVRTPWRRGSRNELAVRTLLLLVLAVLLLDMSYDPVARECLHVSALSKRTQWDEILERARRNPSPYLPVQFITNLALFHKRRLLDEMFSYPQVGGAGGLVFHIADGPVHSVRQRGADHATMRNSDLFLEMGHVNVSYRQADNHKTSRGRTYENLRRLAECNMVSGNYALARKYLNVLEKTLFHRQFARRWKEMIADTNAADRYFRESRARMPTIEIGIIRDFVPLFSLLNSDAHNRMAFDYFMAWCLLDRNSLPMIADYIHLLKAMGYTSMPTHLQEAILLLQETAGITVDTHGLGYDAATVSRFRAFAQQMASYRDRRSAQLGLRSAFGGTYMYYYCFQGTPPAPRRASVHYALAGRLHYQGKAELAVTQYRHALHLEPTFVEAHVELAHALVSLEKETQAAVHYRRALRLKPDAAEAREGLDRITARQTDQGG